MQINRFIVGILALTLGSAGWAQTGPEPVNSHATPEARALLAFLDSISGNATIAGQHNYPNVGARWTDMAYDLTAKYPGLFGGDFGFSGGEDKDSVLSRPAMIAEAERQYRNGAVVTLTWHEVRPTDDEPVTFHNSVQGHLTDAEWKELLTPGSYLRWERIVIALCLLDLTWFVLAYLVHPNWAAVAYTTAVPTMPAGGITSSLVFLVIAIVGTTIAPWQLFFQQSCVAEKRLRFADLKWARLDTLIGSVSVFGTRIHWEF
jgi:hypothetical protein